MIEKIKTNFAIGLQRLLLGINAIQIGFLALHYTEDSLTNKFPVFEKLFSVTVVNACTPSGCWQTLTPFLAATYASIALFSLAACILFRPTRELRLAIIVLAFMHIVMGWARLSIVPPEYYQAFAASKASNAQFVFGMLLLIASLLPYGKKEVKIVR